jgi:gamma-tubulin complex component 3
VEVKNANDERVRGGYKRSAIVLSQWMYIWATSVDEHPVGAQGGALVSLIHGYTDNGDPFIKTFTTELLDEV